MILYMGDATKPNRFGSERVIIAHSCNNVGAWGAGFSGNLSAVYPESEIKYRESAGHLLLGDVQFVHSGEVLIANMIAQDGISYSKKQTVSIPHLTLCLESVYNLACRGGFSIHMPKIGSGLGGGDWSDISKIISDIEDRYNVDTVVYIKSSLNSVLLGV